LPGSTAEVIAIDGKTSRRLAGKSTGQAAIHMVSAFAARQKPALGQVKASEKSNELIAIPHLLAMLAIEGAIVTIDAMGCQRDIAQAIVDQKADDVLALKGNQGALCEDVEVFVAEQTAKAFADTASSRAEPVDADHGRIETRTTTVIHDVGWLKERHGWPTLRGIVVVESVRELPATRAAARNTEWETRFSITSLALPAQQLGPIIRSHRAIENSLHRGIDIAFRDDQCPVPTEHAPANVTTIKHIAHTLIRRAPGKHSLRMRRKVAAWDDALLASLIAT
jgi:predicted transposase YbfD/YdcC